MLFYSCALLIMHHLPPLTPSDMLLKDTLTPALLSRGNVALLRCDPYFKNKSGQIECSALLPPVKIKGEIAAVLTAQREDF